MRGLVIAACLAASACSPAWKRAPHDQQFQTVAPPKLHAQPRADNPSDWWDHVLHSTVLPLGKTVSPARWVGWLIGGRAPLDVNAFGEVPDSAWFENRIGRTPMTPEEAARGPNASGGPAPGPLVVISGKPEGVTPGIVVRDSAGVVWFIKFDAPAYPRMTSGAEIIAAKVLYAAGYHVPETYVIDLALDRLALSPKATTRDRYKRKIKLTPKALDTLLLQLNPSPDGKIHALFSRAVPGVPLGPFSYRGTRRDDPNDRLPHQRRRSLRGLWVFQAWLNNTDTRRQNTLDTFIASDGGRGFVRHYLIDFGDSLGAAGNREKFLSEGYEYRLDWRQIGKRWVSLGLRYPYWLSVKRSPFRSVGIFESKTFDPSRWRPVYANDAFDEATPLDSFWGAAILARITPDHLRAIVETAEYTEPGAAEFIVATLLERRRKLLRYAFSRVLPVVDFRIENDYAVAFTDLGVETGLVRGTPRYRWSARWNHTGGSDPVLARGTVDTPRIDLREAVVAAMTSHRSGFVEDPYITLTLRRAGHDAGVELHVRIVRDRTVPVAIDREVD